MIARNREGEAGMKIAVLDDYVGVARDFADWRDVGEIRVFRDTLKDPDDLVARLEPFEVICVMRERTPLPAAIIERLPRLGLIVTTGMRNLSIDLDACRARGIAVSGTELRGNTTAELAMGLIVAMNRGILTEAAEIAGGGWQRELGRDLAGLALGIVGLGKIGAQMAKLGRAFGMEPIAWSQNLTDERCAEVGVRRAESLPALMAAADVVTVHVVLSERSRGLIGTEALAAMPPGAHIVNTSRGPIVDLDALLAGLRAGRPAKAALDVFDEEPLPEGHPLRDRDLIGSGRLLLTPHLGYTSEQTFRLAYGQTTEAIHRWRDGAPVRLLT
jgi:phosphoglycerate dehydrogenase-like enzyme